MSRDEARLVQQARAGDPDAYVRIYDRYQPIIYRYMYYRAGDIATAEALTAEVFVRLVRDMDRFPRWRYFRALHQDELLLTRLYSIAHELVVEEDGNHRDPPSFGGNADGGATGGGSGGRVVERQPTPEAVHAATSFLSSEEREFVVLKFVEGLDNETVASTLGKPVDAIQPLQQQALDALKGAIDAGAVDLGTELVRPEQAETESLSGEALRNLAHELRTPITVIQLYAELLLSNAMGVLSSKLRDALQVILDHAVVLTRLLQNLVSVRTISHDTLELSTLPVAEWAQEPLIRYAGVADEQGLLFETDLPTDLPVVQGDKEHLKVAVSQMLDNAVKFNSEGGAIRVRAWANDGHLYISVQDEGIGIEAEHLDRVFDRFYQVDASTTRHYGGVGLGLAVAREIAEAHGGRMWAESEGLGKGSVFTLAVPSWSAEPAPALFQLPAASDAQLATTFHRALDEALVVSLQDGATLETSLAGRAEYATELRPLLEVVRTVRGAPRPASSYVAYAAGKRRMLKVLEEKKRLQARLPSLLARVTDSAAELAARFRSPLLPVRRWTPRPVFAAATVIALFFFGGLGFQTWLNGSVARAGTLALVSGLVETLPAGEESWRVASTGDRVNAGDRIRCDPFSDVTVVYFDGSSTDLGPESEVTLGQVSSRRGGGGKVIAIQQWAGQTYNRVVSLTDARSRFAIETASMVATARGTEFAIAVEDGATQVTVVEGAVDVAAEDTSVLVQAGEETTVLPDQRPLAAAPASTDAPTPRPAPLPSPFPTPTPTEAVQMVPTVPAQDSEPIETPTVSPEPTRRSSEPTSRPSTATPMPTPTAVSSEAGGSTAVVAPTSTPRPVNTPTQRPLPTAPRPVPTVAPPPTSTPRPPATSRPPTPVPADTATPAPTETPSPQIHPTLPATNTPAPTNTPVPPTNTPVPPTNTPVPPTNTPVPPTGTPGPLR